MDGSGGLPRETILAWASPYPQHQPSHAAQCDIPPPASAGKTCTFMGSWGTQPLKPPEGHGHLSLGDALLARPADFKSSEMSSYLSAIWQGTGYAVRAQKSPTPSFTPLLTNLYTPAIPRCLPYVSHSWLRLRHQGRSLSSIHFLSLNTSKR